MYVMLCDVCNLMYVMCVMLCYVMLCDVLLCKLCNVCNIMYVI